jgi:tetratricopeptide (TPR) repeat protein
MIEAVISGQAGAYAVIAKPIILHDLEGRVTELLSGDWWSAFRGCTDVRKLKVKSESEAFETCRDLRDRDRALRFTLHLLDGSEDRDELAETIEQLLVTETTADFVSASLYVDALPSIETALAARSDYPRFARLSGLLGEVLDDQDWIRKVRKLFDQADVSEFEDEHAYGAFRRQIFGLPVQRDLVRLVREGKDIEFLLMKLNSALRGIPGSRRALETWMYSLRKKRGPLPDHPILDEDHFEAPERSNPSTRGRGILEQIRSQQSAIEQRLKSRDIIFARKFADDLIRGQKANSTPEQIAKSLSLLSHLAKKNGVPELQREWAEAAVSFNPNDVLTYSHLIDALVRQNRLHDASVVVDQAEQLHPGLFINNSRARILRARGDFEAARELYLKGVAGDPNDPEYLGSLGGAAETLRDMGRYDQALAEYNKLVRDHPTEEVFWCGLASVHLDMGQFDKAIQNFGKALRGAEVIARAGRATAYKHAGQFDQAIRIYEQLLREFPNDNAVLCGQAEVYRAKGDMLKALSAYELAIERNPFTPHAFRGKFDVLRESGRLVEAATFLQSTREQFPDDPSLASAYGEILEGQGDWLSALSEYDVVLKNFPRSIATRLARARILLRINRPLDAINSYNAILAAQPYSVPASLGKAAALIDARDFLSAEKLLENPHRPKSFADWQRHFLSALLFQARGDFKRSKGMFEAGMKGTPFAKMRRAYTAALARQKLRNGEPSVALRVIDAEPLEISNVVRLHALAAAGRMSTARDVWARMNAQDANFEVAQEIARRFKIVEQDPQHDLGWIYSAEERALLLEAA